MDNFEKLLNRSYNFLSFRPRSEKEVRDYLNKKIKSQKSNLKNDPDNEKANKDMIYSIIEKLKEQKFLDDIEFTKWFIEQRSKIKPKALKFIIFELKQKGIDKEIVGKVIDDKEFLTVSDFDKALELGKKRIERYRNEEPKKRYEKLVRFLASKGFDWGIIKKVIDQVLPKGYNNS